MGSWKSYESSILHAERGGLTILYYFIYETLFISMRYRGQMVRYIFVTPSGIWRILGASI